MADGLHRAYSIFEVKNLDDDKRVIEGYTSTPTPDRIGDVLDPKGATFKLPLPLLWQHRQDQPIGEVLAAKVTADGIWIRAQIAPAGVAAFIDDAWALIKAKLVRGFSVGWRPKEQPKVSNGTFLFPKWEWFETSAVTIPMNADASIASVKSADAAYLPASGADAGAVTQIRPAGVGALASKSRGNGRSMKTSLSDQIKQFEASRAATVAERDALIDAATEKGETLDAEGTQQYDDLDAKVKSIDAHLARLKAREAEHVSAAVEVKGTSVDEGTRTRGGASVIRVTPNLEPGIEFARAIMCKAAAFCEFQKGNLVSAEAIAKQRYPDNPRIQAYLKTAVAAGTTLETTWAAPLLADAQTLASEFLEYLRPATIVGKFGTTVNGVAIPSLRRVPFNVRIQGQTSGGSASWVGQGKPKPLTKFDFEAQTLLFTKIAAISVISDELVRFSNPSAEALVRDGLRDAVVARMDSDFIDPAISATSNVRPASITNGVTPLSSAGTSMANVLTDLQNLIEPFILAKVPIGNVVIIMPETLALVLALAQNSLGQREFAEIQVSGGRLRGFPVITTQYAANESSYGNMVIAVNARDIALADDGQVMVDASREASLQMDDSPTNDASTGTGQSLVSMFQTNSIALRAERVINWKKLRSSAVTFMDDVNWGSIGSPV